MLLLEASFHKGLFGPSVPMAFNEEKLGIRAGQVILPVSLIRMLVSADKEGGCEHM